MDFVSVQLVDHTDDWDRVLNFEGEAFNDGVNEGRYAAVECKEMLENGIHSGFMKGFAYGLELGFMESIAMNCISPAGDSYSSSYNHSIIPLATAITPPSALTGSGISESSMKISQFVPSSRQAGDQFGVSQNICLSGNDEDCDDAGSNLHQPADNRYDSSSISNSRTQKRCNDIAARSNAVPNKNIDSFDFDGEVRQLRGLYKLTGSCVGPFRVKKMQSDAIAAVTANFSNEW